MIQRIQTLYLLLAAIALIACLCLPIGLYVSAEGDVVATLYNLWAHIPPQMGDALHGNPDAPLLAADAEGSHIFTPWALMALLILTAMGQLFAIFIYKARLMQSRLAMLTALLLIGWYAVYALMGTMLAARFEAAFRPTVAAALPAISAILAYLAFRAILKDEALVRSLDRLR